MQTMQNVGMGFHLYSKRHRIFKGLQTSHVGHTREWACINGETQIKFTFVCCHTFIVHYVQKNADRVKHEKCRHGIDIRTFYYHHIRFTTRHLKQYLCFATNNHVEDRKCMHGETQVECTIFFYHPLGMDHVRNRQTMCMMRIVDIDKLEL